MSSARAIPRWRLRRRGRSGRPPGATPARGSRPCVGSMATTAPADVPLERLLGRALRLGVDGQYQVVSRSDVPRRSALERVELASGCVAYPVLCAVAPPEQKLVPLLHARLADDVACRVSERRHRPPAPGPTPPRRSPERDCTSSRSDSLRFAVVSTLTPGSSERRSSTRDICSRSRPLSAATRRSSACASRRASRRRTRGPAREASDSRSASASSSRLRILESVMEREARLSARISPLRSRMRPRGARTSKP